MILLQFLLFGALIGGIGMLVGLLRRRFSGERASGDGEPYEFSVTRGKYRRILKVRIALEAPSALTFVLRRENLLDRIAKGLGIASEWETHDHSFDESIFILSDDRTLGEALSVDADLRRAVMDLFADRQAKSVECAKERLWVVLTNLPREYDSSEDAEVAATLSRKYRPALARAGERLAALTAQAFGGERDSGERRARWLLIASAFVGAAGAVGFFVQAFGASSLPRQLLSDRIDHHAIVLSLCVALVAVVALVTLVGRTSRTHLVLLAMLLVIGPGTWLGGRAYYTWRNEKLDAEPPTDYFARIAETYSRSGKSRSYFLVVDRWPDERFERTLQVPRALYEEFQAGDCARFELHRGRLGDPWLAAVGHDSRCDGGS
jgi:hypothetical protein